MDRKTQARYEARANVIKALAHPTRLFIVDELARVGEKCVCELTALIGADMSTVSKHLTILKGVGIVQDEKRGSTVYYRLGHPLRVELLRLRGVAGDQPSRATAAGMQTAALRRA